MWYGVNMDQFIVYRVIFSVFKMFCTIYRTSWGGGVLYEYYRVILYDMTSGWITGQFTLHD